MKKNYQLLVFMLAIFAVLAGFSNVFAANTPDLLSKNSLTLEYAVDGKSVGGVPVSVYRVADLAVAADGDVSFELSGDFSEYPIDLSGRHTTGEWDALAQTLYAYAQADDISPAAVGSSDADGKLKFTDLPCGIYMISSVSIDYQNKTYRFAPALVSLPSQTDGENWSNEQTVFPKGKQIIPTEGELTYKVVKQWVNTSGIPLPNSVTVQILKNGVPQSTHILTADTDWMYTWVAKDDGSVWSVVEKNVPTNYTVTVEGNNTAFIVTNTYNLPPDPPKTGDIFDYRPLVWIMALSGMALIAFGIFQRRRSYK